MQQNKIKIIHAFLFTFICVSYIDINQYDINHQKVILGRCYNKPIIINQNSPHPFNTSINNNF